MIKIQPHEPSTLPSIHDEPPFPFLTHVYSVLSITLSLSPPPLFFSSLTLFFARYLSLSSIFISQLILFSFFSFKQIEFIPSPVNFLQDQYTFIFSYVSFFIMIFPPPFSLSLSLSLNHFITFSIFFVHAFSTCAPGVKRMPCLSRYF